MPKVKLKEGAGKHRLKDGTVMKPGQEVEVSDDQIQAFADKFERVQSAAELMVMAEERAGQEAEAAAKAPGKDAKDGKGKG